MKKFMVVGQSTISVHTEVEAENEEKAIEEAMERGMMTLCYQCSRGDPDKEWVTSGELDGIPEPLDLENDFIVEKID
jgi:hypothetical protein